MNNLKFNLLLILVLLTASACKKNYVCSCSLTLTGYNETINYTLKEKPKDAQASCKANEATAVFSITDTSVIGNTKPVCHLK